MADLLPQSQLPMVRLRLVAPFLSTLTYPPGAVDRVLDDASLSRGMLERRDVFVSAQAMYQLVEALAEASGDPHAGVHAGETLDVLRWDPVADALAATNSFGDFLLRFTIAANCDASSAFYTLETRRERATFTERRVSDFGVRPAHNDGFGVGYLSKILLLARQSSELGESVVAHVCDPRVIPPNYLGMRIASTDTAGFSLTFPASWLVAPLKSQSVSTDAAVARVGVPRSAKEAVARIIEPHLSDTSLSAARVADLMGTSERTLARHLAAEGTSILRELSRLRLARAGDMLTNTRESIAKVAEQVGYSDAGTFARAFRRWSGCSPTHYRRSSAGEVHVS